MTEKNQYKFYLAKMYEFINDIEKIIKNHNNDFKELTTNIEAKHSINMCLVQIGELSNNIKEKCPDFYNSNVNFVKIKGMRNRIVHGYGTVNYDVVEDTIKNSLPDLKDYIEKEVPQDIIDNPYILYDEYYNNDLEQPKSKTR